jgi:L-ascorbate metabolism protein UlaG (beta-lactamase superfamily)
MAVTVRFLGTAAFEIETADGKIVFIDPYLDENPFSPVKVADIDRIDLLLVTHAAYDHLGDAEGIMRKFPDLPLICGADVRGYLMNQGIGGNRICAIPWGMMVEKAGVKVRPVVSMHWSYIEAENGRVFSSTPLGMIIYAGEDISVYHTGDTALFSDMKIIGELYAPKVGLINVGVPEQHRGSEHGADEYLTGEMDAQEVALACDWLRLEYAIPCHHDSIELPQIVEFDRLLKQKVAKNPGSTKPVLLNPGESYVF